MVNRSKQIGTKTETAIVRFLQANGFIGADEATKAQRLALQGTEDQGDIGVCPGVMVEAKGGKAAEEASDAMIASWLAETERERLVRGADVAALVTKRKGKGDANAGLWWAYLPGWTFVLLARLGRAGDRVDWNVDALACLNRAAHPDLPAVRITLAEFATLLRRAGYGDPLERSA